jgi:REP element-mobilizing transposase RayT
MGRGPRIHFAGAVYHVMARGVNGQDIFTDDRDRIAFLDAVSRIEKESSAQIIAYCLMGNHFHLAIKVGPVPLASIMHRILTGYSLRFNARHERTGHLFQARYKAILCLDDAYLAGLIRYIHMNPVRAGFVAAPQEWPWSSVHRHGDKSGELLDFDPWPKDAARAADLTRNPDNERPDLTEIAAGVAAASDVRLDALRSRARDQRLVAARRELTREAIGHGHSLTAIAKWLNTGLSSVSRYSRRVMQQSKA